MPPRASGAVAPRGPCGERPSGPYGGDSPRRGCRRAPWAGVGTPEPAVGGVCGGVSPEGKDGGVGARGRWWLAERVVAVRHLVCVWSR